MTEDFLLREKAWKQDQGRQQNFKTIKILNEDRSIKIKTLNCLISKCTIIFN